MKRTLAVSALIACVSVAPACGSSNGDATNGGGAPADRAATDDGGATHDGGALDASGLDWDDATGGNTMGDGAVADASGATPYVSLKTAGDFVVLAGSAITSTGFTFVNGNVGISPGTAITGFPPGIVKGTIHQADAVAAQAKQDLNDAYNDAKSRTGAPVTLTGELGGRTLGPGLYVSASSLGLDSGDLTLDAAGNEDAIWVFQIASSFVTLQNRKVILVGMARADNVFWNVGSSTTIGLGGVMVGNFLTQVSITVKTGAVTEGRYLTQTGAVTLDPDTTINRPKPVH